MLQWIMSQPHKSGTIRANYRKTKKKEYNIQIKTHNAGHFFILSIAKGVLFMLRIAKRVSSQTFCCQTIVKLVLHNVESMKINGRIGRPSREKTMEIKI